MKCSVTIICEVTLLKLHIIVWFLVLVEFMYYPWISEIKIISKVHHPALKNLQNLS